MTKQEELFLKRVAIKMSKDQSLTVEHAMKAVLADDQRIWEALITMPDNQQQAFYSELSASIYHEIKAQQA